MEVSGARGLQPGLARLSDMGMVSSISITNFRGFEQFGISELAPINVIVGDNAVGKTALLEAIFLTLSGNADKALHFKQWRGINPTYQSGSSDSVVEGIYADLFHDPASSLPISIKLTGHGFENRELVIEKSKGDVVVPLKNRHERRAEKTKSKKGYQVAETSGVTTVPITLTWTDHGGNKHVTRIFLQPNGIKFEGTEEQIPSCYMFAAQIPVGPNESADHYSNLSKKRDTGRFKKEFFSVFKEIKDLSVITTAGTTVLAADVPWAKQLLPLQVLSGGSARAAAILLSITHRDDGCVLVDEVESGIYHARQRAFAEALVRISRLYKTQLIMTTHSQEWIDNFLEATSDEHDDIAFWRMERIAGNQPTMRRFTVDEFSAGLAAGEMR